MGNERLRAAMDRAGISVEVAARQTGVDPKTVQRWLAGRVPHPRHRWVLAEQVDEDQEFLWPAVRRRQVDALGVSAELVAAYGFRSDFDTGHWWDLFTRAERQIDLLGYTLYFLPQQHPGLVELLKDKCVRGCHIRIAIADPYSDHVRRRDEEEHQAITLVARIQTSLVALEPLLDCGGGAEMRFQDVPLYSSIFRFDDEMLVTPHLYATPGHAAPLLHLRRLSPHGVFSRFATHFEGVWSDARPMREDGRRSPVRSM